MNLNRVKILTGITILAILLFLVTCPVMAADSPVDVPASHWAYKSVKLLVDKGYLQLYQDQSFQGDQPVDRFTLATVVAKMLNEIAGGQVTTSKEDVKLLRSLTNEFREELVGVSTKNNIFDKKFEILVRENQVIEEDLTTIRDGQLKVQDEQAKLQKEVQQMISEIISIQIKIRDLEEENRRLKADLERLRSDTENKNKYLIAALVLGLIGAVK